MLLRSLTKHVKDQNWFAVALDFVIVVTGILIAFQITNWSEARQENNQAERILERLEQDFTQQLTLTNRSLTRHKQYLEAAGRLVTGIQLGAFDEERLITDVDDATSLSTPPGPSIAFQELVSSGKTELIRNEELRNTLYGYNSYISFVRAEYSLFTAPIFATSSELMPARKILITGIPSKDFGQLGRAQSVDSSVLLNNPEILNSLKSTYETQDNVYLVLLLMHDRIEEVLTLIKAEQEQAR